MCLGAAFATAEAQIILSVLCRRVTFEPVPGHVAEVVPSVTLRPKGGMPMRVRTRERVSDVAAATRSS
jgi:cytochrome P450